MDEVVEIRLNIREDDVERLRAHPLLARLACGPSRRMTLSSLYFDTPQMNLLAKGAAIRVRRVGDRRIQTIKGPITDATDAPAAFARQEWESEVASDVPSLEAIDDPDALKLLREIGGDGPLIPIFETRFERQIWPLAIEESEVEVALDVGDLRTGCVTQQICEAEFDLQSGEAARLYELALALSRDVGMHFERRTKSARGYALAMGASLRPPEPVKPSAVKLKPRMRVGEALARVLHSSLLHLQANEACALDGRDPEGIHQMRVALRRMRTALTVFGQALPPRFAAYFKEEMRWLQRALGPARDWDVFIEETLDPLKAHFSADPALAELTNEAHSVQALSYEVARGAILQPRYTNLLLHLELWLEREAARSAVLREQRALDKQRSRAEGTPAAPDFDAFGAPIAPTPPPLPETLAPSRRLPTPSTILPPGSPLAAAEGGEASTGQDKATEKALEAPVAPLAAAFLSKRHRKLRREGKGFAKKALPELHAVRIEAKKMRYTAEFFSSLYGKKANSFISAVKQLQDSLGCLNDGVVAQGLVAELENRLAQRLEESLLPAGGSDWDGAPSIVYDHESFDSGTTTPAHRASDLPAPKAGETVSQGTPPARCPDDLVSPAELEAREATGASLVGATADNATGHFISHAARAGGLVAGWHAARAEHRLTEVTSLWKQVEKAKPFWAKPL